MPIVLDGTLGIEGPLGTASVPSYGNTTATTTGLYFPTSTTLGLSTNGTAALTIDASQNVGIGTSSPASELHVAVTGNIRGSSSASDSLNLYGGVSGTANRIQIRGASHPSTPNIITFDANSAERMRIDSSGNVGIGTSSPSSYAYNDPAPLVVANTAGGSTVSIASGATSFGQLAFANGTSGTSRYNGYIKYDHSSNYMAFYTNAGAERMRIDSSGNLLVGTTDAGTTTGPGIKILPSTTTPNASLVYNTSSGTQYGWMIFNTNATNNGYRFYVGTDGGIRNYSANNVNLSDERVKTDIQLSGNYLDKICAIPVRTFKYKDQGDDSEKTLGVIAQEVEMVAPELVNNDGFGETPEDGVPLKTIYQTDLQYALMKCIQELKAELDALKGTK